MKSYTNLEQSKKLAKILPIESADMYYGYIAPYDYSDRMYDGGYDEVPYPKDFLKRNPNFSANEYDAEFPCWSLAALFDVLPHRIDDRYGLALGKLPTNEGWYVCYVDNDQFLKHYVANSNFIDACYEIILKLHEAKLI